MATTTTAFNVVNAVLKIDNVGGSLVDVSGSSNKVEISAELEGGEYRVFGQRWEYSLDGTKKWSGSIDIVASTLSQEALDLLDDWLYAINPGPRTFQMDVPDSNAGSRRYSGEIRHRGLKYPFARDEAAPPMISFDFKGDGPLSQTDL